MHKRPALQIAQQQQQQQQAPLWQPYGTSRRPGMHSAHLSDPVMVPAPGTAANTAVMDIGAGTAEWGRQSTAASYFQHQQQQHHQQPQRFQQQPMYLQPHAMAASAPAAFHATPRHVPASSAPPYSHPYRSTGGARAIASAATASAATASAGGGTANTDHQHQHHHHGHSHAAHQQHSTTPTVDPHLIHVQQSSGVAQALADDYLLTDAIFPLTIDTDMVYESGNGGQDGNGGDNQDGNGDNGADHAPTPPPPITSADESKHSGGNMNASADGSIEDGIFDDAMMAGVESDNALFLTAAERQTHLRQQQQQQRQLRQQQQQTSRRRSQSYSQQHQQQQQQQPSNSHQPHSHEQQQSQYGSQESSIAASSAESLSVALQRHQRDLNNSAPLTADVTHHDHKHRHQQQQQQLFASPHSFPDTGIGAMSRSAPISAKPLMRPPNDMFAVAGGAGDSSGQPGPDLQKHAAALEKRRKRRESHNAVERRRRDNINERIQELAVIVPDCLDTTVSVVTGVRPHKGDVLRKSADYIRALQQTNAELMARVMALETELMRGGGRLGELAQVGAQSSGAAGPSNNGVVEEFTG